MGVSQLGYLVLDVSDINAWRDLAASIIGAEERPDEGADLVQLRFDEHHHRITLHPAKTDSVAAIGWEVPSLGELESVRRKVAEQGFSITEGTREDLADRKVEALFRFRDMDGVPLEIYYRPWTDDVPFHPSRPMSGFNCGPLKLGHVV
jgi:catechol 2,3-dioxygenase-like lactoylglutathione lyase family enzyme